MVCSNTTSRLFQRQRSKEKSTESSVGNRWTFVNSPALFFIAHLVRVVNKVKRVLTGTGFSLQRTSATAFISRKKVLTDFFLHKHARTLEVVSHVGTHCGKLEVSAPRWSQYSLSQRPRDPPQNVNGKSGWSQHTNTCARTPSVHTATRYPC